MWLEEAWDAFKDLDGALSLDNKLSPVTRVVELLKALALQTEKEGKKESKEAEGKTTAHEGEQKRISKENEAKRMASEAIKKAAKEAYAKKVAHESQSKRDTAIQVEAAEAKAKAKIKARQEAKEAAMKKKIEEAKELERKHEVDAKARKERQLKERRSKRRAAELQDKAEAKMKEVEKKKKASEVNTKVEAKWLAESAYKEQEAKTRKKDKYVVTTPDHVDNAPKQHSHCVMCKSYESWDRFNGREKKLAKPSCKLLVIEDGFVAGATYDGDYTDYQGYPVCMCPSLTCKIAGQCQVTGSGLEADSDGMCIRSETAKVQKQVKQVQKQQPSMQGT